MTLTWIKLKAYGFEEYWVATDSNSIEYGTVSRALNSKEYVTTYSDGKHSLNRIPATSLKVAKGFINYVYNDKLKKGQIK